jgi:hypothetical protein
MTKSKKLEKWKIGTRNEDDNTLSIVEVGTKRTFTVCSVHPMPHFDDRQKERANLIAVAPQLLSALKSVTHALESWVDIQDDEDARDSDATAIKKANALINRLEKNNGKKTN